MDQVDNVEKKFHVGDIAVSYIDHHKMSFPQSFVNSCIIFVDSHHSG